MPVQQKFTTRVIVTEGDIRKMTMATGPDTLEDLLGWLKDHLQTNYSFTLQYQDPEFNKEFCNLTHLSELPKKPTMKIIPMVEPVPVTTHLDLSSDSVSLADTKILFVKSLKIPKFPVDVEYRLRQGNLLYLRDGVCFKDPADNDLYSQTAVGILCIDEENPQMNPARVGIILEGNMVMEDLANPPQTFCVLFGLINTLHLEHPKYMKNTFFFVQQVMLNLGKSELAPKNQLSMLKRGSRLFYRFLKPGA
ncbi:hypothetical protein CRENBAI_020636 [Crenichthys baileyi]|uniref:Uncharacterized protein n=1 Tax=Crenichthys baileyi TaxID=28760 RepID=A0AAV9RU82_9TELE